MRKTILMLAVLALSLPINSLFAEDNANEPAKTVNRLPRGPKGLKDVMPPYPIDKEIMDEKIDEAATAIPDSDGSPESETITLLLKSQDKNKDGKLDADEREALKAMLASKGKKLKALEEKFAERQMKEFDKDNDGKLDVEELKEMLRSQRREMSMHHPEPSNMMHRGDRRDDASMPPPPNMPRSKGKGGEFEKPKTRFVERLGIDPSTLSPEQKEIVQQSAMKVRKLIEEKFGVSKGNPPNPEKIKEFLNGPEVEAIIKETKELLGK